MADEQLRNLGGHPSKLTPELQEQILTAIREGGCTYADACLKVGISTSTFHRWKKKGQEQTKGRFSEFFNELKGAEAGFRAVRLQRIVDAAEKSQVRVRKTVRSMGDGDDGQDLPGGRRGYRAARSQVGRLAARAEISRAIQPEAPGRDRASHEHRTAARHEARHR